MKICAQNKIFAESYIIFLVNKITSYKANSNKLQYILKKRFRGNSQSKKYCHLHRHIDLVQTNMPISLDLQQLGLSKTTT